MHWKKERHLVFWGFVLAAAVLAIAGRESCRNTVGFSEASEWQKHTYEVLSNIEAVLVGLVDAETGQRGYLLTGDGPYLEPYRTAVKSIHQTVENLRRLTSDNPNQQRRIQRLEPLVAEKLAELQPTLSLRKKEGLASPQKAVLEGSGKRSMDQIRTLLSQMPNEEEAPLVTTAADCAEARVQIAASLNEIVILDMMLPEVSGFDLLGEWRASRRTAGLPEFVLTSKDLSQEEQSYLRTHAEALLHKQQPWHEELLKQLDRVTVPHLMGKV